MWTLEETGETEEIEQLSQLSMQESITGMLLYHVGFSGIWYGWNKILSLYSLVWKETPAALATRKFIWVVTISSRIPNKQAKNSASHAQVLVSTASRGAVKSQIPSRYLSFSRFSHRILVKSQIPKIRYQTLFWSVRCSDDKIDYCSCSQKSNSRSRLACLQMLAKTLRCPSFCLFG